MTLHVPTHPAGYVGHHYLRDALLIVAAAIIALVLGVALLALRPVSEPSTTSVTSAELANQYRAEERAMWAVPVGQIELANQARAEERSMWTIPVSQTQLVNDYRAGERALYGTP